MNESFLSWVRWVGFGSVDDILVFHLYFIFGRHEKGQRSNQNNDFRGTIQIEMLRNIEKVG